MAGPRPDYPASMKDARAVRAGIILAFIDFAIMAMVTLWLFLVCGTTGITDPDTKLTLFHAAHLLVDVPALLLFAMSALFLPIWFVLFGLVVFFADIYVIVARINLISAGTTSLFCSLFLLLFDIVFFIVAIGFLGFAISGITKFGLFGDAGSVRNEYTVPQANATYVPQQTDMAVVVPTPPPKTAQKRVAFENSVSFD